MTLLDAITTLLDATVEQDDRKPVMRARKVLAKKAEQLRKQRARRLGLEVVPEPLPATAVDCAKCGTAGSYRGCTMIRHRWVETLACSFCKNRWERLIPDTQVKILTLKVGA